MTATREQVLDALFTKLGQAVFPGTSDLVFRYTSRRLKVWSDLSPEQKPAMVMLEANDTRNQQPPQGLPSKLMMRLNVVIYTHTGDPSGTPSILLNNCIDAIDHPTYGILKPDDLNRNVYTLGGLVYRCWVEGTIIKVPGDLDGEGMAVVPVSILLP